VFGLTLYKAHADRAVMSLVPGSLVERMMRDGACLQAVQIFISYYLFSGAMYFGFVFRFPS
jgi:hypothetical protein